MNIALIGYGNMGKEVESVLSQKKHTIVSISFKNKKQNLDLRGIRKADVAIDFTAPEVVWENIQAVLPFGVAMVIGTTGWYEKLPKVEKLVKTTKTGLIYGQNFSIGANIFFKLVGYASQMFARFPGYDVAGFETHHTGKKDSPSGTAKKLASVIMENFPKKKRLETGRLDRQIQEDELHFASLRAGRYFGHHEVIFDSLSDEIKLSHTAHTRRGFAEGAVLAAEFIKGKKGLFTIDELFSMKGRR